MNAGVQGATLPNHMIEHPLSAHYDIAHGAGLSIVIPAWLKYAREQVTDRIISFGREVLRIGDRLEGQSAIQQADTVIAALEDWYRSIGTPVTLSEGGLTNVDVEACITQALSLGELWGVPGYDADAVRAVYDLCNG